MVRVLLLLGIIGLSPIAVAAEEYTQAPVCTIEREGQVACMDTKLCECGYQPADVSGLPARFKWDCGIQRPACNIPGAEYDGPVYQLPQALGIDRSSTTVIQNTGENQN